MAISEQPSQPASRFALWNLGFRPFFLFAGILAVVSMALWMHIYTSTCHSPLPAFPSINGMLMK